MATREGDTLAVSHDGNLYSGNVDWNAIYREGYPLERIARRLTRLLPCDHGQPVLMAGFAEVAAVLSRQHAVRFVEYSPYMVEEARRHWPQLAEVVHGDILDVLAKTPAPCVAIACRISANWQQAEPLKRLVEAILRHPRRRIVIDAFDVERLPLFTRIVSGSGRHQLAWQTLSRHMLEPEWGMHAVHWRGETPPLSAWVSAFEPATLTRFLLKQLPGHEVRCLPPLIPQDPGFTLVITPRMS